MRWSVALILVAALTLPIGAPADTSSEPTIADPSKDLFKACTEAAQRHDDDAAMALCGRAISAGLPPSLTAIALDIRGNIYLERHDTASAIADFTSAMEASPNDAASYRLRSVALATEGDFDGAISDASAAIQRANGAPMLFELRGDLYHQKGDDVAAIHDYAEAIRWPDCTSGGLDDLSPGKEFACKNLQDGIAAWLEGDNATAAEALDAAVHATSDTQGILRAAIWRDLAFRSDRRDATTPLNAAVNEAAANSESAKWPLPLLRYAQGHLAENTLELSVDYPDPEAAQARACDVTLYVSARALIDGHPVIAAKGFAQAQSVCAADTVEQDAAKALALIAARPVDARGAGDMASCNGAGEAGYDPATIIGACGTALADPDLPDAWRMGALSLRAAAYRRAEDTPKAIADLDAATALEPGNAELYRLRGLYRLDQGEADGGLADLTYALQLDPEFAEARINRAWARVSRGETAPAISDLTHAIALTPHQPRAYLSRGVVAYLAGEDAHAVSDFSLAIDVAAPQPAPYALLWLALAVKRSHLDDGGHLAAGEAALDPAQWPAPILRFLQGEIGATDLATAATDPTLDPQDATQRDCEASFYYGESARLSGDTAEAKRNLTHARDTCTGGTLEYNAAAFELGKM